MECLSICKLKSERLIIPHLIVGNTVISDDFEKAIEFNKFFVAQTIIDDTKNVIPQQVYHLDPTLTL